MQAKAGAKYCAEHLTADVNTPEESKGDSDVRVPCPLDPAHSVYTSKLAKHLKKCNARIPTILPSYHRTDCNIIRSIEENSEPQMVSASLLAKKVLEAAQKLPSAISTRKLGTNDPVSETEKHRLQQAALSAKILSTIKSEEPLQPLVFIEMGAGKGGLSAYIWEEHIKSDPLLASRSQFIFIDRSNSRCKKDAKMKHEGARAERIFIDIKDLDLAELVKEKCPEGAHLLFISKHLCGAATCLTINALNHLLNQVSNRITLSVALCCHQCCSWSSYPNRQFLKEHDLASNEHEFGKLKSITSWAVCGRIKEEFEWSSEEDPAELDESTEPIEEVDFTSASEEEPEKKRAKVGQASKEEIGRLTKRLLDYGRQLALKGFSHSELSHYISEEITLENALLFGLRE